MEKGKGQYVLWDGETKRGYDRLRGHCILGGGKGEGVCLQLHSAYQITSKIDVFKFRENSS